MSGLGGLLGAVAGGALGYFTGGVGSILTGAAMGGSIGGASDANRATAASTAQQMAFQERMANTTYQRSVADLDKAGLNPILAASRGFLDPSPVGSSYVAQNEFGGAAAAGSSAQAMMTGGQQYNLTSAQANLANIESKTAVNRVSATTSAARIAANEARISDAQTALELAYMRDHPTWWMLNRAAGNAASTAVDVGRLFLK